MYIIIAIYVIAATYFLLHVWFFTGLKKSIRLDNKNERPLPFVTVLVAARNEEDNISNCINSLKSLVYEKGLYEIILINDNSNDSTYDIMIRETAGLDYFIILDTKNFHSDKLAGKTRALSYGLSVSKGQLIMMTDADCVVRPGWIKNTVKNFDENTGMICGFTRIRYGSSLFADIQSLDWLYLQSLASSSSGIGRILSCIGNNLSFNRKAYDEIGGYENLKFSVTEDLSLMRTIEKTKYSVKYPVEPECLVETVECKNIKELYRQKKRWFRGGTGINFLGYCLGTELYFINFILLTGFLYMPLYHYLFVIALKMASELLIMMPVYKRFGYNGIIRYFPALQLYFALYGLFLPFTFLTGYKIVWKDRKH
ncbi:MAG: glycosyltransferase [Ignavibacteria bacterium]|nr:glycosyltransferase [Ignavibacteria bacterium]